MAKKTLLKKHYYSRKHSRKHSRKQSRKQSRKHSYYIVRCYSNRYELNYKYLEEHLKKLNLSPDNYAMNTIDKIDRQFFTKHKIPISNYCDNNNIKYPSFDKSILKADVFFINTIQPFSNTRFNYYPKYFSSSYEKNWVF